MVIFKITYKDLINKNKNGNVDNIYIFSEDNYNRGKCGLGHTLTGDITQGNANYDSARANMGEPWMMFTKDQGQELIDNTDHEWTSINGVNGTIFTSKSDTSKSIFILAAGAWTPWGSSEHEGMTAWSWATTWNDSAWRWSSSFSSSEVKITTRPPYYGVSIRAVRPLEW